MYNRLFFLLDRLGREGKKDLRGGKRGQRPIKAVPVTRKRGRLKVGRGLSSPLLQTRLEKDLEGRKALSLGETAWELGNCSRHSDQQQIMLK